MTSLGRRVRRNMLIGQMVHERAVIKVNFTYYFLNHSHTSVVTPTKSEVSRQAQKLVRLLLSIIGVSTIEETYRK